jgi:hypothetical protein
METIKLRTHIGADSILRLETPVGGVNCDVEVIVVMATADQNGGDNKIDALGWRKGFFYETYGSFADDPLERPPQAKWTKREELE